MKIFNIIALSVAMVLLAVACGQAEKVNETLGVSASVGQTLELSGWIKEMSTGQTDPGTQGTLKSFPSTLAFGALTDKLSGGGAAGCLYSPKWYAVFLVPSTSGRPYRIQSSATSINGTGVAAGYSLPNNSFVLKPDYNAADKFTWSGGSEAQQGADTNTAHRLGAASSAVGNHDLYDSGTGAAARIIRAYYSIPSYPAQGSSKPFAAWKAVPLDQHHGSYSGSVTISLIVD